MHNRCESRQGAADVNQGHDVKGLNGLPVERRCNPDGTTEEATESEIRIKAITP